MARRLALTLSVAAVSGIGVYASSGLDPTDISAVRIGRAVWTTALISADYMRTLKRIEYGTDEYWAAKSQVHLRSAERLLELCCANRGTFIKAGQHLGALDYLLPEEYTRTLRVLHSSAPTSPIEDVHRVVREELGKEVGELFQSFDPQPLGTASLAQVHRATLHDGRTVAVKVQHHKVRSQATRDLDVMEVLVRGVAWLFPDFRFLWLVEEARKNLPVELDFMNEGRNAERAASMLHKFHFLKVPRIFWELSTDRVLMMEFVEGGQINDRVYMERHGIDVNQVSRYLGRMYSEMIFVEGFVHCDPHPGNVLVHRDPASGHTEVILLDHGIYQTLSDGFRVDYCRLWQALLRADVAAVEKHARSLGAGELYGLFACVLTARSWDVVQQGIDRAPITSKEESEVRGSAAQYLPQISDLLNRVPREMLLLLKTNDLLRGIETVLRTRADASSFITMSRCCVRALCRWEVEHEASWVGRARVRLGASLTLCHLRIYELLLWLQSSAAARWICTALSHASTSVPVAA
ncbi:unnamed protein product [Lampetra fluviatilis]